MSDGDFETREMELGPVVWIPRDEVHIAAIMRAIYQLGGNSAFIPDGADDFDDDDEMGCVRDAVIGGIQRHNATPTGIMDFYRATEVPAGIFGVQFKDGLAVVCAIRHGSKMTSYKSYGEMLVDALNRYFGAS